MATIITAPEKLPETKSNPTIFLAGSIECGSAELWQDKIIESLKDSDVIILNPRRPDWDSSWEQKKDNLKFQEQVEWELDGLEMADHIVMYFAPGTKSPISLLELGLYADSNKLIVCCPEGFWRKGNVDIVCERYDIKTVDSLKELKESLLRKFPSEAVREDLLKRWVVALRSGHYKQGKNVLRSVDDNYCCLGVLCEVYNKQIGGLKIEKLHKQPGIVKNFYSFDGCEARLPPAVKIATKINNCSTYAVMNDDKNKSFAEIADYIEECELGVKK